jgi:hypothetical protein
MALTSAGDKTGLGNRATDVDQRLDDAVAQSFPASDPVSLSQPHERRELGLHRTGMSTTSMMLIGGGLLAIVAIIALRR